MIKNTITYTIYEDNIIMVEEVIDGRLYVFIFEICMDGEQIAILEIPEHCLSNLEVLNRFTCYSYDNKSQLGY